MQEHRNILGHRCLRDICIPGSHDSGTYRLDFGTIGGKPGPVLTQTRSIFDQLELGVRRFDLRPTLANRPGRPEDGIPQFSWNCGHYTGEGGNIGWQGGSCGLISEVISDINRFTKDNAELIILDVTHVACIFILDPISSQKQQIPIGYWDDLLDMFRQLDHLFKPNGDNGKPLEKYSLNDFIGNGKAAVVVNIEGDSDRNKIIDHGFWPEWTLSKKRYLSLEEISVTRMQTSAEAVWSLNTISTIISNTSVLGLAEQEQNQRFPWLLQEIAKGGVNVSVITMDRIENPDLLTICLAVSYQRYYRSCGQQKRVAVYGGSLLTDQNSLDRIQTAIDSGKSLPINFPDPWYGIVKSCAVFYYQNGLLKGRWSREGSSLHFEHDVFSVKYGNKEVLDSKLYLRLLKSITKRESFYVSNQNVVGDDRNDPQKGVRKICVVRFRNIDDYQREESAQEGDYITFPRIAK